MTGQLIASTIGMLIGAGMVAGASVMKRQGKLSASKYNFWLILAVGVMCAGLLSLLFAIDPN